MIQVSYADFVHAVDFVHGHLHLWDLYKCREGHNVLRNIPMWPKATFGVAARLIPRQPAAESLINGLHDENYDDRPDFGNHSDPVFRSDSAMHYDVCNPQSGSGFRP